MAQRKGFTLMEIIVVLMIIGVCVALTFPNFYSSTQQTSAQTAKNNLLVFHTMFHIVFHTFVFTHARTDLFSFRTVR